MYYNTECVEYLYVAIKKQCTNQQWEPQNWGIVFVWNALLKTKACNQAKKKKTMPCFPDYKYTFAVYCVLQHVWWSGIHKAVWYGK